MESPFSNLDGDKFLRARRNFVAISALILIYASGAVTIGSNFNGTFLGLPIQTGNQFLLEAWLLIFLLYFCWRYHSSLNGTHPLQAVRQDIEQELKGIAGLSAWQHFNNNPEVASEPSKYSASAVGATPHNIFLLGHINSPLIGLSWPGRATTYPQNLKSSNHAYYMMPRNEVAKYSRAIIRKQIFSHNAFSEVIWPYIIAFIAYQAITAHLGYAFGKHLFQTAPL